MLHQRKEEKVKKRKKEEEERLTRTSRKNSLSSFVEKICISNEESRVEPSHLRAKRKGKGKEKEKEKGERQESREEA